MIQVEVTPQEKVEIKVAAARLGKSMSEFIRDRVLPGGEKLGLRGKDDSGLPNPPGPSTEGDPGPADPEFAPPSARNRAAVREPSPELAPIAKESQEAFIARRSTQLHGQGKTPRHAAQLAKQEWEAR